MGPQDIKTYFVDGNTADYSKDFKPGTLKGVKATLPGPSSTRSSDKQLQETDPKLKDFTYGPESYDATMLTALAAIAAKRTTRRAIGPEIIKVSTDGTAVHDVRGVLGAGQEGRGHRLQRHVGSDRDWARPAARPRPPSVSTSTSQDNTYKNIKYTAGVI